MPLNRPPSAASQANAPAKEGGELTSKCVSD
jgi:hypothetical protein